MEPTLMPADTLERPYKFLIVDDSLFARKNMAKLVQGIGGVVAGEASNGREAVEQYFSIMPDLVLMDLSMPEMEGIEAVARIREKDGLANVIIVSSQGHEEIVKEAIGLGARHYITKPFNMQDAASVIKFVLTVYGKK